MQYNSDVIEVNPYAIQLFHKSSMYLVKRSNKTCGVYPRVVTVYETHHDACFLNTAMGSQVTISLLTTVCCYFLCNVLY